MSENTIKVSITFSFKGEIFSSSTLIDLDSLMKNFTTDETEVDSITASFLPLLAASIDIDTYSYAYEIMQASELVYSEPAGIAGNHLTEDKFNYQSFSKEWLENKNLAIVQTIADKHQLDIDFQEQSELRDALLDAFFEGKKFSGKDG